MVPVRTLSFPTTHIGRRVDVFAELPSTNDHPPPEPPGSAVVADHQSAGRGQYGRAWLTRPGEALLLSVFLDPPTTVRRPVVLTAWAAVGVAEAVAELTGIQPAIKWPNDVLVGGKKVCGILIEQRVRVAVGLGLNLNQSAADFVDRGLPDATSLAMLAGRPFDRDAVLGVVLAKLDTEYARVAAGSMAMLEAGWRWRLGLLGNEVTAELFDGSVMHGRLRQVGFDGVELACDDGPAGRVLRPEAVRKLAAMASA
ncbi:MAG: biotin--[acetyl-CoA-carboxylase] ligase [Fimbriiglobus sp.]|jgi:BirA family biotin operon repressor/biotin-[acetyl-CoA-carboxylase] ligase|nr:biotin--[acetyl-CoA-carboxylase] ligase [Fimbriiglobus sp.]